jgi:hypothetical protein
LGDDVNLKFKVTVGGKPVIPHTTSGALYSSDKEFMTLIETRQNENQVSTVIPAKIFRKVGDYTALFYVNLLDMGKKTHGMHFKMTPTVLGEKKNKGMKKLERQERKEAKAVV